MSLYEVHTNEFRVKIDPRIENSRFVVKYLFFALGTVSQCYNGQI
jgi:hypothetical protein